MGVPPPIILRGESLEDVIRQLSEAVGGPLPQDMSPRDAVNDAVDATNTARAERRGRHWAARGRKVPKSKQAPVAASSAPETPFETHDNGVLMHKFGIKVMHINDPNKPRGVGMTVAYKLPEAYTGKTTPATITVATAVVHPLDHFNKKKGTATAVANFLAGRTVTLPRIEGHDETQTISAYFGVSLSR
jgi:hypothetical protein